MAAIFGNFRKYFAKNGKEHKFASILLNRASIERFHAEIARSRTVKEYLSKCNVLPILAKKFRKSQKWRPFLGIFENFCQKWQNTNLLLSP